MGQQASDFERPRCLPLPIQPRPPCLRRCAGPLRKKAVGWAATKTSLSSSFKASRGEPLFSDIEFLSSSAGLAMDLGPRRPRIPDNAAEVRYRRNAGLMFEPWM